MTLCGCPAYIRLTNEGGTPLSANKKHKALSAYENSALQGNAAAELKIGDYYYYGLGTAVNYRKAVAHYRAARCFFVSKAVCVAWQHWFSCVLRFDTNVRRATPRRCSTSSSCICAMFV